MKFPLSSVHLIFVEEREKDNTLGALTIVLELRVTQSSRFGSDIGSRYEIFMFIKTREKCTILYLENDPPRSKKYVSKRIQQQERARESRT